MEFEILPSSLLKEYCQNTDSAVLEKHKQLKESELSISTFSFYTSVSAVFSSKIEGVDIDLDSYVKHKRFGIEYLPDYTQKIDDLYNAYSYAKNSICNKENIEIAHQLITKHILPESKQGKTRTGNMFVTTSDGRIEYVATAPSQIKSELEKFYNDLSLLMTRELTLQEIFFYASLLHLVYVKIHPFEDGNGRTSRLIEKWFLSQKIGEKAWLIQSEKNYYINHQLYYSNIRKLGLEYEELDYSNAFPFLVMLPQSLNLNL